jgi:Holliday junction DNA helicase RuvB
MEAVMVDKSATSEASPSPSPASSVSDVPAPIVRRLVRGLPCRQLIEKIKETERITGAGEREQAFYLADFRDRKLYQEAGCTSFSIFLKNHTSIGVDRGNALARVGKKLEKLPVLDEAFARGKIPWSSVRAAAAVATEETDAFWAEYCRSHTSTEVEHRAAETRPHEDPRGRDGWDGRPVKFPYKMMVPAHVHQAIEFWCQVLAKETGGEVTLVEAIFEAVRRATALALAEDDERAAAGKRRKLPASYRLVIFGTEDGKSFFVPTVDGPRRMPADLAKGLLEGAEVLRLTVPVNELPVSELPAHELRELEAADRAKEKPSSWNVISSQVETDSHPAEETPRQAGMEPGDRAAAAAASPDSPAVPLSAAPVSMPSAASPAGGQDPCEAADRAKEKPSSWKVFLSQVEVDPYPLIEHAHDLSTPEKPAIPKEKRDKPADAEMVKRILARDPLCRVPGCGCMSERAHHVIFLEHGGLTIELNLVGLCRKHHHMVHEGLILMSGTAYRLRVSDAQRRSLVSIPVSQESPVRIEIPPADPQLAPLDAAQDHSAPPAPACLPAEIDRSFWLAHRGLFEWSERRKALAYRPELGEEMPEDPARATPAAPAPAPDPKKGESSGLKEFRGQRRAVENISLAIEAARGRGELPPPILLAGPPGLGKSTIARLSARELGSAFHQAQGPSLADLGSLVGILPDLEKGSVLFIDEIHRVPAPVAELLYQALDEGALSIPVLTGGRTRLARIKLEPFLLIGATTEECLIPAPLLSRFGIRERLSFYAMEDLVAMAATSARSMGIELTAEGAAVLARGARGTPRLLLSHLARARDLAGIEGGPVTAGMARRALERAGIDRFGLSETDRRILEVILEQGRPIGVRSLADVLGENPRTVAEIYEPFLLREGFIARTWRGRIATEKAGRALLFAVIDGLEIDGFDELDMRSAG